MKNSELEKLSQTITMKAAAIGVLLLRFELEHGADEAKKLAAGLGLTQKTLWRLANIAEKIEESQANLPNWNAQ